MADERPRFRSVSLYNDPSGLLSFWYAPEWQLQVASSPLPSLTLVPDPRDPVTHIAIAVQDLGEPLAPRERPAILRGVREGLAQLPGCRTESLVELDQGGPWGVEWVCTFSAGKGRCRRRARLFFSDRYQYSVVCQGSTEERYAYWQGMFEFTLLTVATASSSAAAILGAEQSAEHRSP